MTYIDQRIFNDPLRGDGHNAEGLSGDCLKTTVVNLTGRAYEDVPHFAQYLSWWDTMRRWARSFNNDFICLSPEDTQYFLCGTDLVVGSGPSPRGDFWHSALFTANLELVHDPHPSRKGLVSLEECFVLIPYELTNEPNQYMLTGA